MLVVQEHTMVPSRLEEMDMPVRNKKELDRKLASNTMELDRKLASNTMEPDTKEQDMPELNRQEEQSKKEERSNLGKMVPCRIEELDTRVLDRQQEPVRTKEQSKLVVGRQEESRMVVGKLGQSKKEQERRQEGKDMRVLSRMELGRSKEQSTKSKRNKWFHRYPFHREWQECHKSRLAYIHKWVPHTKKDMR